MLRDAELSQIYAKDIHTTTSYAYSPMPSQQRKRGGGRLPPFVIYEKYTDKANKEGGWCGGNGGLPGSYAISVDVTQIYLVSNYFKLFHLA